jgi:betaine lipid synthase
VPCKQYRLIHKDGLRISEYVARTFDGVARNSHLRTDNYFYYSCLTGHFSKDNCPSYLEKANFEALKAGAIDRLTIMTSTFMEQLCARTFTKVHRVYLGKHASELELLNLHFYCGEVSC